MDNAQALIALESEYCAKNYAPIPAVLSRGEGVYVWDVEGNRYLDMMSAYSAVSHGHGHPELLTALQEQAARLCIPSRAFFNDQLGPLGKKLANFCELDAILPMNTGAEAVETAIKAARRWGYEVKGIPPNQAEIIVAEGNFHGRTTTICGFSSEKDYRDGFGPFTPGFVDAPFGDIEAFEAAFTERTCAVLIEPMQGEAGIIIPPTGFLKRVEQLCRDKKVLLILDEIQTGLGRTGKRFAAYHEDVQPDGLILGKALGGGILPISAFVARAEVMDVFRPGSHGSTFGGNPLACHVASRALDLLVEEKLTENSAEMGEYLMSALKDICPNYVIDLRGKGLWIGIELDPQRVSARTFCERLMERGVLSKETHETVIRLAPPLTVKKTDLDFALSALEATFQSFT